MPHQHAHPLLVRFLQHKELNGLYASVFMKTLADALIGVFTPVYLLTLGYGIADIGWYYLLFFAVLALGFPPATLLAGRWGVKRTMALGSLSYILYYGFLNQLQQGWSYAGVALFYGIAGAFYYAPFHLEFTHSAQSRQEGKEVSMLKVMAITAGMLGPLLGALIVSEYSFTVMFAVACAVLFCSILPLFLTEEYYVSTPRLRFLRADAMGKAIAYQANGALNVIVAVFWPAFIYVTLGDMVSLGAILSISSLALVAWMVYLGRVADRQPHRTLTRAAVAQAPLWPVRLFFLNPVGLFVINLCGAATQYAIDIPFEKIVYQGARRRKERVNYFLFREMHLALGRVALLGVVVLTGTMEWLFIVAGFIVLCYLVLR